MQEYDICIVGGLGHIGLPLGISLAHAQKSVVLYDINQSAKKMVSRGQMPFVEAGSEELLSKVLNKTLFVSDQKEVIAKSYFVIVVIGTPVDEHLNPQFTLFRNLFDELLPYLHDDQHIILRSTVFPGSTQKIKEHLESKGKKTRISFCPERIAQGKAIEELHQLPQIVSSFGEQSASEVKKLFALLTDKVITLDPLEAELAKLFTNSWRYIQFATANQFYQIAQQNQVDFYKIYEAMTDDYPRAKGFPKAGFAAGPCLFKDTMQLAAYANNNFFLGHAAMLINEGLPNFIVSQLKATKALSTKTVGILGMTFKANNDDKRESLAYKLKNMLQIEAKTVLCSDVYIKQPGFLSAEKLVEEADIIVVGAPHKAYLKLELPNSKQVIDIWNFLKLKEQAYEGIDHRVSGVHNRLPC